MGTKRQRVKEPIRELPANSAPTQAPLSEQAPPPHLPVPQQPVSEVSYPHNTRQCLWKPPEESLHACGSQEHSLMHYAFRGSSGCRSLTLQTACKCSVYPRPKVTLTCCVLNTVLLVLQRPLLERLLHECPDGTAVNDLFQVIAIMSTLAAEKDMLTLQAFSSGLAPGVMADIVIANLDHLPRREDVAGAQNASSSTDALASLMQVGLVMLPVDLAPLAEAGILTCTGAHTLAQQ